MARFTIGRKDTQTMPSGPLHTALDALAALTVPGIRTNFGLNAIPEKITRAQLPALILVPMLDATRRRKYGEFGMAAPSGAQALAHYLITHLLLVKPVGTGLGARSALPGLVDLVDDYGATLRANAHLSGALFYPVSYSVVIAPIHFAGVEYHAAQFWHTLTVQA
jgi:hypothetical protein